MNDLNRIIGHVLYYHGYCQIKSLQLLKSVKDPEIHKDIVSMGMIKDISINEDKLAFTLELTTPVLSI